jgi:hypothetical protein
VISNFFSGSKAINVHYQLRQDSLKLKRKWAMQIPWFQLATTLIGVNVMDTFLLCSYHKVFNISNSENDEGNKVSIQRFAGILANQLINYASK